MIDLPGFTPDPEDPRTGYLTGTGGQPTRVFLKHSRNLERHAAEKAALALIHNQPGGPLAPRLMAECSGKAGPVLVLSYEEGVNLADLLSFAPDAPPISPWYEPVSIPHRPTVQELAPLLIETGRAVRALHNIPVEMFVKLGGLEPNPHWHDARAYTLQEFAYRTGRGAEKGFLPHSLVQAIEHYVVREGQCLTGMEPPCLVHNDLHAGNVRAFADPLTGAWRLRALYDFEMARGWLPEWDLVGLLWNLTHLTSDSGLAWCSFLEGYGPLDPARLRLFDVLRAITAAAWSDRYPAWGLERLKRLLECEDIIRTGR